MKILTSILFLLMLSVICPAQAAPKRDWTNIISPKKDLSVLMPPDFLVYNEEDEYRAYATFEGVIVTVWIRTTRSAKSELEMNRRNFPESEFKTSRFEKGDFIGYLGIYEKDGVYSAALNLASSKAYYSLSAFSRNGTNPALEKFLYSVKLENLPLFKQENILQSNEPSVSLETLKTSSVILEALKTKDAEKLKIKYDLKDEQKYTNLYDTATYSRALITLKKPRANYTDTGRMNGVSGTITLKVVFRADGQVGDITVLKKLGSGLDEEAVNAARKIKFLPGEIDGKPVDVTRQVQYSFTIY